MRALKITNSITRRDEKSLEKYLNDIAKYDVLTPEEELNLFRQFRAGDETALVKILRHNLRFVVSVAKQYQHLGLWLGDLVNEGNIGLIKAARRFDETKGFKFISYAVWWIRQSILQAVNEKSRKIRLPLNRYALISKVMNKLEEIQQEKGREPSLSELAAATGLPESEVQTSLESYKLCRSLDAPLEDGDDVSLNSFLEDEKIPKPDHDLSVRESQQLEVQMLLKSLRPKEAMILEMYYGIGQKYPKTLSDISDILGLSKERTRQIRDRGIRKLRRHMQRLEVN